MLELRNIPPAQLHGAWELIQDGLDVCLPQDDQHPIKEDVYAAIKNGTSWLYLGYEGGNYVGFTILTPYRSLYDQELFLHIWYAYREGGHFLSVEAQQQVENIAKSIGAKGITFRNAKDVFERWAKPLGYTISQVQYMKYL